MLQRSKPLLRKTPLRASKPMRRHARKPRPGHAPAYLAACKGEPCYLQIPGVCRGECARETVVPCHANWSDYGKGMGRKADDIYTVPGCHACHCALDQGSWLTKNERRAYWEWAYTKWSSARAHKLGVTHEN